MRRTWSDADRTALQAEIDSKQKSLDSSAQKVREESQAARRNLRDFIIQKMALIVVRLAQEQQLDAILDVSPGAARDPGKFWPDGLVLWSSGPDIDLKEASSTNRKPTLRIVLCRNTTPHTGSWCYSLLASTVFQFAHTYLSFLAGVKGQHLRQPSDGPIVRKGR